MKTWEKGSCKRSTFPRTAIVGFGPVFLIPIRNTAELAVDPASVNSSGKNVSRMAYMVFHMEWRADSGLDYLRLCHNMLCCNP